MTDSSRSARIATWIVDHPARVVVLFLVLTAGFAAGLNDLSTSTGMDQFSEDVDAYATNEEVDETFRPPFEPEGETTILLHSADDVLSRAELARLLETQARLEDRADLRVRSTRSPASLIAMELDPSARTAAEQRRRVERATDAEIRRATRAAAESPEFRDLVGEDFSPRSASATAAIGVVEHDVAGDDEAFQRVQLEARHEAELAGGDVRVFGQGITDHENEAVLRDSMAASIPTVVVLLLVFLAIAYRDPFDLFLGVVSLAMALVWTFGALGHAGIPFSQLQVALPPLLLAIGVDFGIHTINRYREAYDGDVPAAMHEAVSPLAVAFAMVMSTSVIGFSANVASGLSPIADFGLAAAIGIASVTLVFAVFLPAAKVLVERWRERTALPSFHASPLGSEGSALGRLLTRHLRVTSRLPVLFLVVVLVTAGLAGYYGQGVDSSFEDEDMLPPEELPASTAYLPEPMTPGSYTTTENLAFLETEFDSTPDDSVTIYVEGPMREDYALESLSRAERNPPESFVRVDGRSESTSILTVVDEYAAASPSFARLVERNDRDGNGVPDRNLEAIYDALEHSPYADRASRYVDDEYRSARVVYAVDADATDQAVTTDAASTADRYRFGSVETGDVVVFQRVADEVYDSAVRSLAIALSLSVVFLVVLYYWLEGRPLLGVITLSPIVLTVLFLVATMRYLSIPFNTLTATILSISVGIGVDYAIHVVHRFVEEVADRDPIGAARVTLRGTGGALFGTTITTIAAGLALNVLSITPILVQFGLLIALSVAYSFLASIVVLPAVLLVWADPDRRRRVAALRP